MERKEFKITIDASKEKVWAVLWDDATYRKWTAAFSEGSHAVSDWKQGSKVLFLDEKGSGMAGIIEQLKPNEYISINYYALVKENVEEPDSEESKAWAGSMENYALQTVNGKTELTVELAAKGIPQDMLDYFIETWPKALAKLKELSEGK